jgi:phosphopantetheinyl transferase
VGVDAASSDEFTGSYPFHRVFRGPEWTDAAPFCAGDRFDAAALLWTLKEAAVKALGEGFNGPDPLEVVVRPLRWNGKGVLSGVEVEAARLCALSVRDRGRWFSLALWEGEP